MTTERTPTLAGYEPLAANALKPGPLDAGMVSLLTAGRSVLRSLDAVKDCREVGDLLIAEAPKAEVGMAAVWYRANDGRVLYGPTRLFEYVGERGDDDWITGSWSGNPVPGRMIVGRTREGCETTARTSESLYWPHEGNENDIIAFRLVEEASPVAEGLGSSAIEADTHRATERAVIGRWTDAELESAAWAKYPKGGSSRHANFRQAFRSGAHWAANQTAMVAAARAKEAGE
jgi:hypothetical protein